ncbi:MAG: TIGR01777 family oxidoreductase, partial [Candidatus Eremiobacteraeota bacterium]|nr:TIGR01777 family oxidoreductase [Candidatus Eremiobacteraeota bacterium]
WTDEVKREILESRTVLPQRFLDALAAQPNKPGAYVSASASGYYGYSLTAEFTESDGPGSDFLADVCAQWEATARNAHDLGMRVACVRTGVALGSDGGAMAKVIPPFKMGAGGIIGNGKQWFPWVHVDDVVGVYLLAIDGADGALNATAPHPVTNGEFTKALGHALHRPTFLPVPTFALRSMLGEGADVLLNGQRVLPKRTQELGYAFKYPTLDAALADVLA